MAEGAQVVDLNSFRAKKALQEDRKVGVQGLVQSANVKHYESPAMVTDSELSARIERIKASISRINKLMDDLGHKSKY